MPDTPTIKATPPPPRFQAHGIQRWEPQALIQAANQWLAKQYRKKCKTVGDHSPFWSFYFTAAQRIPTLVQEICDGTYRFSPLKTYRFPNEEVVLPSWEDRLAQALLFKIIKPTFRHCISPLCFHLGGPSAVRDAIRQIEEALQNKAYLYAIRVDIRSFYASIDHKILLNQIDVTFQDHRLLQLLHQVITTPIDRDAALYTYSKGIALRSSLSPFFAALYLTPLDRAFEKRKGIYYIRFGDDILILIETKSQYQRAKKTFFKTLSTLNLALSPTKSKMGQLKAFHFLGAAFEVTRTTSDKSQSTVTLHNRSYRRALCKVKVLCTGEATHPPKGEPSSVDSLAPTNVIQEYLARWGIWWRPVVLDKNETFTLTHLLTTWFEYADSKDPELVKRLCSASSSHPAWPTRACGQSGG